MDFPSLKMLKKDVRKKTKKLNKITDKITMNSLNPISRAMNQSLEYLQNLEGKKVTIEVKSLYDQISTQLVIKEYISGKVMHVDHYGIMLESARRKKYVNNKYHGEIHIPSSRCMVYHKIINYIYLDNDIPVMFKGAEDKHAAGK
ncbi:MAG: hypothetical protein U9P44_00110 [archaeon]|nr:hypothetical protein [archaeon]